VQKGVRLIADKTTNCGHSSGVPLLADAGFLVFIGIGAAELLLMH
jgi:hypothetical protein